MAKTKIDCLLIHVPQETPGMELYPMVMAMGLFALADYLQQNGYSSRILHCGVEKIVNENFSIEDYLREKDIGLIGISLHWHYQSASCLRLIHQIKSFQPEMKIVLGGLTASFFANEIMASYKNVDFIVCGDGEIPLLRLVHELSKRKPDFSRVPNLFWRFDDHVIVNDHSYVASETDMNRLCFSNFNLMENFSTYMKVPVALWRYSRDLLNTSNTLSLCVGRGCPVNCAFCSGSNQSQRIINRRKNVIFRSLENVLCTIEDARKAKVECLAVCFDPQADQRFYIELFRFVRQRKINLSMAFECWGLPTFEFIDEFEKTFGNGPYSKLILSPETASERLRKRIKGFFYTNHRLWGCLEYIKKKGIRTEVYFSYPLPFETVAEARDTFNLMENIQQRLGNSTKIIMQQLDLDPGSPMFLDPARYQITRKVKSFQDYLMKNYQEKFLPNGMSGKKFHNTYKKWLQMDKADYGLSRGWAHFHLKEYKMATQAARIAMKFASKKSEVYHLLATSLMESKKGREALKVLQKAVKEFPGEWILHLGVTRAFITLQRYERAVRSAQETIALNPKAPHIHFLLGYCFEKTKQYHQAIREMKKAGAIDPQEAQINFSLFRCYRNTGQKSLAQKELDQAILKTLKRKTILAVPERTMGSRSKRYPFR